MTSRAARYRKPERASGPDTIIVAHIGKNPRGKIRLFSLWLRRKNHKEEPIVQGLPVNDPRYVFDDEYSMRKLSHELVRRSGQYTKFYDCRVRIVYDSV